ncbi:hypothetical protein OC845_006721 [Tilletia horrida]|nr:hypothetical protein OC845_006721 [Tilletia horrida]
MPSAQGSQDDRRTKTPFLIDRRVLEGDALQFAIVAVSADQGEVFELLKRNVESTRSRLRVPASAVPHAEDERATLSARELDWLSVLNLARRGDDGSRRMLHKLRREIMGPHGNDGAESDKLPPGSTMSSTDSDDADDASPDLILAVDLSALSGEVHEVENGRTNASKGSDGPHMDVDRLLEGVVEDPGGADDLPTQVLVVDLTDRERLDV